MTWTRGAATARWRVDVLDLILRPAVALHLLNRIDGSFAALAFRRLAGVLDQKRVVRRACGHVSGRVLFEKAHDVTVLHRFAERLHHVLFRDDVVVQHENGTRRGGVFVWDVFNFRPREAHCLRHTEVRHRVAQTRHYGTVQSTTNHFPLLSEDRWL